MKKKNYVEPASLHRWRYARYKAGISVEEIARTDRVRPNAVEASIKMIEAQQQVHSLATLEEGMIETITTVKDLERQAIAEALQAEKLIFSTDGDKPGEVVAAEPDHDIRLRAVDSITEKAKAIYGARAKGNSLTTNVNVGVGVGVASGESPSFESRLREIQKRRKVQVVSQSELPAGAPTLEVVPEREKLTIDGGSKA